MTIIDEEVDSFVSGFNVYYFARQFDICIQKSALRNMGKDFLEGSCTE